MKYIGTVLLGLLIIALATATTAVAGCPPPGGGVTKAFSNKAPANPPSLTCGKPTHGYLERGGSAWYGLRPPNGPVGVNHWFYPVTDQNKNRVNFSVFTSNPGVANPQVVSQYVQTQWQCYPFSTEGPGLTNGYRPPEAEVLKNLVRLGKHFFGAVPDLNARLEAARNVQEAMDVFREAARRNLQMPAFYCNDNPVQMLQFNADLLQQIGEGTAPGAPQGQTYWRGGPGAGIQMLLLLMVWNQGNTPVETTIAHVDCKSQQ